MYTQTIVSIVEIKIKKGLYDLVNSSNLSVQRSIFQRGSKRFKHLALPTNQHNHNTEHNILISYRRSFQQW